MANRRWTDEQLRVAVRNSHTKSDALRKLGLKVRPGNYRTIDIHIRRLGIDCSHMKGMAHGTSVPRNRIPLESLLVEHSSCPSSRLKRRLLSAGMIEEVCSECGCGPLWRGKRLVLVLDHINGVHDDSRIANLRLLCPNCNSQQPTFCRGRSKMKDPRTCSLCGREIPRLNEGGLCHRCKCIGRRKVERPSGETLKKQVANLGFRGTGRLYGVSDNAIRKWIRHADEVAQ